MRRNKLLLCIALILVFAMSMSLFVACDSDGEKTVVTPPAGDNTGDDEGTTTTPGGGIIVNTPGDGSTGSGSTASVNGLNAQKEFTVEANDESDIAVYSETKTGKQPVEGYSVYEDADNDGTFYLYAPATGWPASGVVVIQLSNGASLVDYPGVSTFKFTVAKEVSGVQLVDGIRTYDASQAEVVESNTDEKGDTYGTVTLMGMSRGFDKDEVFLLQNEDGTQSAFKALYAAEPKGGIVVVSFVKPELTEVFTEFQYSQTTALSEDSEIVIEDNLVEQLQNSELAQAVVSMFESSPEFDVNVELVDGVLKANITITVPNVVVIDGQARTDLVINLANDMAVELTADIDADTASEQFSVYADITNDMTATVSLGAHANIGQVANVQELFQKLYTLANDSNDNPTAIQLFKWTLPIANGVASISYDADLVFAFNFAGQIDFAAKANLDYRVGVEYDKDNGIELIKEEGADNGFDSFEIAMKGKAELKVGVSQEVSFDILAGVLGIGLQAELGNYNRVYAYGETTNLINDEADALNGGVYFEGGFYYDVNLTYGLKLGSLLNLSDKADIAAGEIMLYGDPDDRYVEIGLVQSVDSVELTSKRSLVPAIYSAEVYDLVTGTVSYEPVDGSELVFTGADGALMFTGNVVEALLNDVNSVVTVKYGDFDAVKTTYVFSTAKPTLDFNNATVTKSEGIVDKTVKITYNDITADDISVIGLDPAAYQIVSAANDEAVVRLDGKELLKLTEGHYDVTFVVDGYELGYTIDVAGKVGITRFKQSDNVYEIFTADQIKALSAGSANYAGMTFNVTSDIDLGGAVIAPIANFKGALYGNGFTVSGYVINAMNGNNAAFISVNDGVVNGLTLDGTVAVSFDGKTGNDYKVAGLAAVNNGTIENVTVKGSVDVKSNSLSAFIDIDAAMVAAVDNGTIGADAEGTVKVTVAFDLANVTVNAGGITSSVADADVEASVECVNGRSNPIFTDASIA